MNTIIKRMANMQTHVVILGGGISGLLMAERLKQRMPHLHVIIIDEKQNKIHPFHLHKPIEGIPALRGLKPVRMAIGVWDGREHKNHATIRDVNAYGRKVFGFNHVTNINNFPDPTIYPVHKDNLERLLGIGPIIHHSRAVTIKDHGVKTLDGTIIEYRYLISTIPLPNLLKMANVETAIEFKNYPFYTAVVDIPETGLCQMIYNTSPGNITRTTLLGDRLFIESVDDDYSSLDLDFIQGIYALADRLPDLKQITPGRINNVPQEQRKPLLHWLTAEHDIMVLGRYGAWTFKVTNDVWEDTQFIVDIIYNKEQVNKYKGGK